MDLYKEYQEIMDFGMAYSRDPNSEALKKQCLEQVDDLFTIYTGLKEENKLQKQTCRLETKYWKKDQEKIEWKQAIIKIISNYLFPEAIKNLSLLEEYHAVNEQYLALVDQTTSQVLQEQNQLAKLKQFFQENKNTVLEPKYFHRLVITLFTIETSQVLRGQRMIRQSHQINAIYDGIGTTFSKTTNEEIQKSTEIQKNIAILTKKKENTCSNRKNMIK